MRPTVLVAAALAACLAVPAVASAEAPRPGSDPAARSASKATDVKPRSNAWEAKVVALTNARRRAHGRKPLKAAPCPDSFAEPWTRHLARTRTLTHQSLTPMLGCPHTSYAGENIAYGYSTPRALVSAWMHSPGHRANILSPHFHRIGVSGWRSADGVTYATQDFVG